MIPIPDNRNDGGPAFPSLGPSTVMGGMSLRDYFASHAPDVWEMVGYETIKTIHGSRPKEPIEAAKWTLAVDATLRFMWAEEMVIASRETQ